MPLVPAYAGTQLLCFGLLLDSRLRGNERGPARLSSFRNFRAAGCGYNATAGIGKLQAAGTLGRASDAVSLRRGASLAHDRATRVGRRLRRRDNGGREPGE